MIVRNEKETDHRHVEELIRKAFYNLYVPGCTEHYLARVMRGHEDFIPELDLVAEGENGYIVDPEDTHAFAEKIDQIFEDENRLKEMGTRSYERAHAFAFEEVAKGCIDALCYVMGKAVR